MYRIYPIFWEVKKYVKNGEMTCNIFLFAPVIFSDLKSLYRKAYQIKFLCIEYFAINVKVITKKQILNHHENSRI